MADGNIENLVLHLTRLAAADVIDLIQIREKDLSAQALFRLTQRIIELVRPYGVKVLVNDRADVAMAAGADGVHLPGQSIGAAAVRRLLGKGLIGVSCHDLEDLRRAEAEGADFVVLSPVFAPLSKVSTTRPLGLAAFGNMAQAIRIPVFALGGITAENSQSCLDAGASGVAGITLFSHCSKNAKLP